MIYVFLQVFWYAKIKSYVIFAILSHKGKQLLCLQSPIEVFTIQPGLKDLQKTDKHIYDDISFAVAIDNYSHSLST